MMLVRANDMEPDANLVIGIVNNMPESAKLATQADFVRLLTAAAQGRHLRICCFDVSGKRLQDQAETSDSLWNTSVDGLIVTGTEPLAASMVEEPIWPKLANLVDWAGRETISTVWSCLAAQAAVLRLDGLERRKLCEKLSGVFDCNQASQHELLAGAPQRWPVPHSRYNDLDERQLVQLGYQILSNGPRVGADLFIKPVDNSLFVFLQGHPEYGAQALMREYRRDVRRFLLGQRMTYPSMPEGYFSSQTVQGMLKLRAQAVEDPKIAQLAAFDVSATAPTEPWWWPEAVRLYANWLNLLAAQKANGRVTRMSAEPSRCMAL